MAGDFTNYFSLSDVFYSGGFVVMSTNMHEWWLIGQLKKGE